VAFSKADLYSIRSAIEKHTPHKCAIIYGQLPPETRSMQARLFNEDNTGYDVLVASDAIGMGLNLNIKRVVFHTTIKFDGVKGSHFIEPSQIKQIGGRAGRKSSQYKFGEVTTWQELDLAYVRAVMAHDAPVIRAAGIFPTVPQIELFSDRLKQHHERSQANSDENLAHVDEDDEEEQKVRRYQEQAHGAVFEQQGGTSVGALNTGSNSGDQPAHSGAIIDSSKIRCGALLKRFADLANIESTYFLTDYQNISTVSNWLQCIPLSLEDRSVVPADENIDVTFVVYLDFSLQMPQRTCGTPWLCRCCINSPLHMRCSDR
jgi:superfamily II DNA/RNA helicase